MTATAKITDTKTFAELRRLGAVSLRHHNVGQNWFTPNFSDDAPDEIVLWDGQISCWGSDDAIATALASLPSGSTFEDCWEALGDFPNNA